MPWDGPVDPSLRLTQGAGGGGGGQQPVGQEQDAKRRKQEAQRIEEQKKKRDEEDQRRTEQAAALAVRKVIQKVRIATPENYDALMEELVEAQATHVENLGAKTEMVSQEAEKALEQAQKRIDEINQKRIDGIE